MLAIVLSLVFSVPVLADHSAPVERNLVQGSNGYCGEPVYGEKLRSTAFYTCGPIEIYHSINVDLDTVYNAITVTNTSKGDIEAVKVFFAGGSNIYLPNSAVLSLTGKKLLFNVGDNWQEKGQSFGTLEPGDSVAFSFKSIRDAQLSRPNVAMTGFFVEWQDGWIMSTVLENLTGSAYEIKASFN